MIFLFLLPTIISLILISAHSLRIGNIGLMMAWLSFLPLMFLKRAWIIRVIQIALITSSIIWANVTFKLINMRLASNMDWGRLALIMGAVILFNALAFALLEKTSVKKNYNKNIESAGASACSFFLTTAVLIIVKLNIEMPMLLVDRFFPGMGWLFIFFISLYAALITEKMLLQDSSRIRLIIWTLFSAVFFTQLILGLFGMEKLLMTGELHLPVPAMIIAGPLYRGSGWFMPLLFIFTILIVGPGWCSHLCYIGAWDNLACKGENKATGSGSGSNKWQKSWIRFLILGIVVFMAVILRLAGISSFTAVIIGAVFGIIGLMIMIFISRKIGLMIHCTVYCPIGLISNYLGKLSPFRIQIGEGCTSCGLCAKVCRYGALSEGNLEKRKTGITCTLCGDCISTCKNSHINYSLPGLTPERSRMIFITLIVSLHAVFLAIARI